MLDLVLSLVAWFQTFFIDIVTC